MTEGLAAWRDGRLIAAHRAWTEKVAEQPAAWSAAYHLARLDGAFGRLSAARVAALRASPLSDGARRRVDALDEVLTGAGSLGALEDWDIAALIAPGAAEPAPWWLDRGHRAWQAGLFGLAAVLVDEAVNRDPSLEDDAPAWTQGLSTQIDALLAAVGAG